MAAAFNAAALAAGCPARAATEHRFHATRRWRLDIAVPHARVALEIDGGIWLPGGGRHTRGAGWLADAEKSNAAALLGWRLLRCTPGQARSGHALALLLEACGLER